jgi:hypothetical protein
MGHSPSWTGLWISHVLTAITLPLAHLSLLHIDWICLSQSRSQLIERQNGSTERTLFQWEQVDWKMEEEHPKRVIFLQKWLRGYLYRRWVIPNWWVPVSDSNSLIMGCFYHCKYQELWLFLSLISLLMFNSQHNLIDRLEEVTDPRPSYWSSDSP